MNDKADRQAYAAWLDWHRHMIKAMRQQGETRYTVEDYEREYPTGDGIPRNLSGQPFQPLHWNHHDRKKTTE